MRKSFLLSLIALLGLTVAAQAAVDLSPLSSATALRFQGIAAFQTSAQPVIDVTTANLLPPNASFNNTGPVSLTAFGEVDKIFDLNNTTNQVNVTPSQQITFTYTGATLTPVIPAAGLSPTIVGNDAIYTITSKISGGTLTLYDNSGNTPVNVAAYFNQPLPGTLPGTSGPVLLTANTPADATGTIVITFHKSTTTGLYDTWTINNQVMNGGNFDITGGLWKNNPILAGKALSARQVGVLESGLLTLGNGLATATVNNQTVTFNTAVNKLAEGSFDMDVTTTPIPEPASIGLLGLAGLVLLSGRRSRKAQA